MQEKQLGWFDKGGCDHVIGSGTHVAGPMLLRSLTTQDMYLAGAIILLLSVLTVIGTLVSDILLALIDPRIRYGSK